MTARSVSWRAFQRLFAPGRDGIRVSLDWQRLDTLHRAGAAHIVHEDHALDGLPPPRAYYAPWYADAAGRPTDYRSAGARPLNIADLATGGSGSLTEEQRQRVAHFEHTLPVGDRLCLATLDLGGNRRLVLDGNHRLVAVLRLVAAGGAFGLSEFRISAPLHPALLPDLRHWVAD
ncbi:hypothetical protein [Streptomyces sp. NPDC002763]|uniref:hypothetical protein n=1 Tax=Streptomyces sp. NPDC002763 TaxID=3154427 RepID=UPI00332AC95E